MWNETSKQIFKQLIENFTKNQIKYFVLRNYEELPDKNIGKDIDIVVEPEKIGEAIEVTKKTFAECGLEYVTIEDMGGMKCLHGIGIVKDTGIHIDLMANFNIKGMERYSFEELYSHTDQNNGFVALQEPYVTTTLLIDKMYGNEKVILKDRYRESIRNAYNFNCGRFGEALIDLTNEKYNEFFIINMKNNQWNEIENSARKFKKIIKANKAKIYANHKIKFALSRFKRIVLEPKKKAKIVSVIAGEEKVDELIREIEKFFVIDQKDGRVRIYKEADISRSDIVDDVHYDRFSIILGDNQKNKKKVKADLNRETAKEIVEKIAKTYGEQLK